MEKEQGRDRGIRRQNWERRVCEQSSPRDGDNSESQPLIFELFLA